ncbi:unnamed protein product [Rangifer tarandus platyrhynchus]|uniref:Uncharacterized protein n=1 Tax=Rangifer tarandus platyrhynchus TaxID=3082113 RepID=A0ABN8ZMJ4_RANTA|nr:unnamed protein product [Rangifer tarandus platyrhynchus]
MTLSAVNVTHTGCSLHRPQRHEQVQGPQCFLQSGGILRELRACAQGWTGRRAAGTPRWARAGVCPRGPSGEATDRGPGVHTPAMLSMPGLHPGAEDEAPRGSWCTRLTCGRPNGDRCDTHTADDPHRQGQRPGQPRHREGRKQDSTFLQRLFLIKIHNSKRVHVLSLGSQLITLRASLLFNFSNQRSDGDDAEGVQCHEVSEDLAPSLPVPSVDSQRPGPAPGRGPPGLRPRQGPPGAPHAQAAVEGTPGQARLLLR